MKQIEQLEQQLDKVNEKIIDWAKSIVSANEFQIDYRINRIEDMIKLRRKLDNRLSKA